MSETLDEEELSSLLEKTSRTFAVAIPLLGSSLSHDVGFGYLLFRVIDTLEDASHWPRDRRVEALREAIRLLDDPSVAVARDCSRRWLAAPAASDNPHYTALIAALPRLVAHLSAIEPARRLAIVDHARRTASLMLEFQMQASVDGRVALRSVDQLRRYCYAVAGVVGELLTELFLLAEPRLCASADVLRDLSAVVGEALQLTNILKDAEQDAREGRSLLPPDVGWNAALDLACDDLARSRRYVAELQAAGASGGILAFVVLPLMLSARTLRVLRDLGPGARLARDEVIRAVQELAAAQQRCDVQLSALIG